MRLLLFLFLTGFFLSNSAAFGQELKRSASFGAQVGDLNDSLKSMLGLASVQGTRIQMIFKGSSAEKAGFAVNDVLVSLDDEKIVNTAQFVALLKKHSGGDKINVGFYRDSKLKSIGMTLFARPMETSEAYDIIYSSFWSGNNHLRTIITKPKGNGLYPAVLIIGGVGCYSIDNPSAQEIKSIKMWSDSLTGNGFVTMRVEKTGMGDSRGIPCNTCDFKTEMQSYADGLEQLQTLSYVNPNKIFIAGFSIGGIIAPIIAAHEKVRGIIVYGTAGRNWLEYEMYNSLRQQTLIALPADSLDNYMRSEYIRLYGMYVEKKLPDQIIKEHPETAGNFFEYPMRAEYFQQVADVNIRGLWMNTISKVLALHGSSDFVSSAEEHKIIAETVNRYHPGNATYLEIADSDHWGLSAESEMASFSGQQKGLNPAALVSSLKWLEENL